MREQRDVHTKFNSERACFPALSRIILKEMSNHTATTEKERQTNGIRVLCCVPDAHSKFGHRAAEIETPCKTIDDAFRYVCEHHDALPTKTMMYKLPK